MIQRAAAGFEPRLNFDAARCCIATYCRIERGSLLLPGIAVEPSVALRLLFSTRFAESQEGESGPRA